MARSLWVESYRPKTLDEYVWQDEKQRKIIESWIAEKSFPHALFSGVQGTGKTSLAELLIKECGIQEGDVLRLNASRERNVETVQTKITNFVSTWPLGDFKVVLLDEADSLSPLAMRVLRGEMEKYADTARFIITCAVGDTPVATPYGQRPISEMSPGVPMMTPQGVLMNRHLRKTTASQTLRLTTEHGYTIQVTQEHRLQHQRTWYRADQLKVGDRVTIDVGSQYGNDHEFLDDVIRLKQNEFEAFLRKQDVPSNMVLEYCRSQWNRVIAPWDVERAHKLDNAKQHSVLSIAQDLGVTRAIARGLLIRLKKVGAATEVSRGRPHEFVRYAIDTDILDNVYHAFYNSVRSAFGYETSNDTLYYWATERRQHLLTVEDVVERVRSAFSPSQEITSALARVCGFLFGDGHLCHRGAHFAALRQDVLERVIRDLSMITGKEDYSISQNGRDTKGLKVQFSDRAVSLLFNFLGVPLGNKVTQELSIPGACHESKLFFKNFMQSLYDCDGNAVSFDKNNKTIMPLVLRQNTTVDQPWHSVLAALLKKWFDIDAYVTVSKPVKSSLQRVCDKMRVVSTLMISGEDNVYKYLSRIGSYYEQYKIRPDALAYIRYKSSNVRRTCMSFEHWKAAYDYRHGLIEDRIANIEVIDGEVPVYDCCLEECHVYVTSGFLSHNCNYPQKIIPAIHSRVQGFEFKFLDRDAYILRTVDILQAEEVEFEPEVLMEYVEATYPDLRKCINLLQQHSTSGKLELGDLSEAAVKDYVIQFVDLFNAGKFIDARKLVVSQAQPEEYNDLYRYFYEHLDLWGDTEEQQDEALLAIRRAIVDHATAGDPEILMASLLVELKMIKNSKGK